MKKIILGAIALVGIFSASSTFACSCMMPESPTKSMEKASKVFVGTVKEVPVKHGPSSKFPENTQVSFEVTKNFKNTTESNLIVHTLPSSAMCGFNFEKGEKYIVYTYKDNNNKEQVSLCSRTALASQAKKDLQELSPKTYTTQEAFEKAEGKTCKSATDGCNTFFINNGKVGGGTLMYCEDTYGKKGQEKWSCLKKEDKLNISDFFPLTVTKVTDGKDGKNLELDSEDGKMKYTATISKLSLGDKYIDINLGDTVRIAGDYAESYPIQILNITDIKKVEDVKICTREYAPVCGVNGKTYSNSCIADKVKIAYEGKCEDNSKNIKFIFGKIIKIEQGTDGSQITIETSKGKTYITAVSIHDTVTEKYEAGYSEYGFILGENVKVYYTEIVDGMNLLIGDKVEIISKGLSENDENLLKHLEKNLDKSIKSKLDTALGKYEKKIQKLKNPQKVNNKVIEKIEDMIFEIIMKYPQDTALPEKASKLYNSLSYLELNIRNLDFEQKVNTQIANPASTFCIENGGTLEIKDEKNGQVGYCKLKDGKVVEEWEYYNSKNN